MTKKTKTVGETTNTDVEAIDVNQVRIKELMARVTELEDENGKLRLKSFSAIENIIRKANDRYEQLVKEHALPLIGEIETGIASKVKSNVVEETTKQFRDVSKLPENLQPVAHYCAKLRKMARSVKALHDEWSDKAKGK